MLPSCMAASTWEEWIVFVVAEDDGRGQSRDRGPFLASQGEAVKGFLQESPQ